MSAPQFGGLGGVRGGRPRDDDDEFEAHVEARLGAVLRADEEAGRELWSALANMEWIRPRDGATASYSFRAAGDLIAAVIGRGDYMDWYCSGPYGIVSARIYEALAPEWVPVDDSEGGAT